MSAELCEDCPPLGYPTNKTRCLECPRRDVPLHPKGRPMNPTDPPFFPLYRSILQLAAGHSVAIALDALSTATALLIFECADVNERALIYRQFDAHVKFLVTQLTAARQEAPPLSTIRPN